jgi:hypothetical protein
VTNLPISQALRQFLESFRLPGEAPVISLILEEFANLWFDSYVGEKVCVDQDAAFVLCYARNSFRPFHRHAHPFRQHAHSFRQQARTPFVIMLTRRPSYPLHRVWSEVVFAGDSVSCVCPGFGGNCNLSKRHILRVPLNAITFGKRVRQWICAPHFVQCDSA